MIDYQELLALMRSRRSVRRFLPRRPQRREIEQVIEAACWAPSNHNRQAWKFIVLEDQRRIAELAERVRLSLCEKLAASGRSETAPAGELLHFAGVFAEAPTVILAMHKRSPAVGKALLGEAAGALSAEAISTAMAVQNLLLAAQALGMGACVMTAPLLAREVWQGLGDLPAGYEPTCLVTLGYPAETPAERPRKPLHQILEYM